MGLSLKNLVTKENTTLESFAGKIVAIDAYNAIYQFLSTIRGIDGANLADSEGRVTSHLAGLLSRNVNFLAMGIKPVYVFDGKPPILKAAEIEKRKRAKKDATVKYEIAVKAGNMEDARKFAQQTTAMRDGMVDDSKKLLDLFGIPYVNAPSEGEATAAHLTKTGQADFTASQDYDSILFGAKRLIRNFTVSGKRKIPNRNMYVDVYPEIVKTDGMLRHLDITAGQLVDLGIMIGTDFNPDGFERIGPKTALKLIKQYKRLEDVPAIQDQLAKIDYRAIRKIFLEPDVAEPADLEFHETDHDGVIEYLVGRDFTRERVAGSMNRLKKAIERKSHTLEKWF